MTSEFEQTRRYYDEHAAEFVARTLDVDIAQIRAEFLHWIAPGGRILDVGCGSGRDTLAFKSAGYQVVAIDVSDELIAIATRITGQQVEKRSVQDVDADSVYDGVWACASLLHLTSEEVKVAFTRLRLALKKAGVLYVSFKLGDYVGIREGRYFHDLREARLRELLQGVGGFSEVKVWVTSDKRPEMETQWVNGLFRRML